MKMLNISPDLKLPLDAVTQTFGILAVRGAGKSNAAVVMAEEMHKAGLHWVVIDPKGDWWGIRSAADGKGPGLPVVIFGGRHGDVPLEPTAGEMIADLVVDQRLNSVLDVSQFTDGERNRFLAAFADRFYRKKDETQPPTHLYAEECDEYIPQKPMREQILLVHFFQRLVKMGRARGIGVSLISQRSAVVNKNVLTQTENLIVLRTTSPQDRAAVAAWLDYHSEKADILQSLPSLESGHAWMWSPHFLKVVKRIVFRRRETFDSGATPSVRSHGRAPATLADIDLGELRTKLAATIERAKAEDPKELQRKIIGLARDLATAKAHKCAPAASAPKVVEVPVMKDAQLKRLETVAAKLERAIAAADSAGLVVREELRKVAEAVHDKLKTLQPAEIRKAAGIAAPLPHHAGGPQIMRPIARGAEAVVGLNRAPGGYIGVGKEASTFIEANRPLLESGETLNAGERRILEVLGRAYPLHRTKAQIGTLAGMTPSGGTFRTYFPKLKRLRLLAENDIGVVITPEGLAAIGGKPAEMGQQDVVEMWRRSLNAGERKLLDLLINARDGMTKELLARAAGMEPSGGTFRTYLPVLKRNGLAQERDGFIYLGDALMLAEERQA